MSDVPVSFRISPRLNSRLQKLAETTDRPKSWHIARAVEEYLQMQLWQMEQVRKGLEDSRAGRTIPHEQVMAEMDNLIRRSRRKRPAK